MTAGKKMAEFVGEKNGEEGQGKRKAADERRGVRVQEFEGLDEFVPGDGLMFGIGDGEMRARDEASTKREEKEQDGEEQGFTRRVIGNGGVVEIGGWADAPTLVDWKRRSCSFWKRAAHERGRGSRKMNTL
jgi:hypothetical protein